MQPCCFSHVLPVHFPLFSYHCCLVHPKSGLWLGWGETVVLLIYLTFVLHKHWSAPERWMRALGRRSLGCGDCVISRHAPSCICDITATFLSTELEQLRPLSNSSSPVHPLPHILASLFSQTLSGDFSSVWVLNPCSQVGNRFLAPGKPIIFFHYYAAKTTQQLLSRLLQIWACAPPLPTSLPIAPLAQSSFQEKPDWDRMGRSPHIINEAHMHISTLTVIVSQWYNAVGEGKKERGRGEKKKADSGGR